MDIRTAIELHRSGDFVSAEAMYRSILVDEPNSIDALYLLGLLALATGRAEEAAALLRRVADLAPGLLPPFVQLGHALRSLGNLDDAETSYQQALAIGESQEASDGLIAVAEARQWIERTRRSMTAHYATGQWSYLGDLAEAARYGIVAAYVRAANLNGAVLDAGCGEGVLLDHLPADLVAEYHGLDISSEALGRHRGIGGPQGFAVHLVCAPLEEYRPPAGLSFSAIIFNEVLYYAQDPLAALRRYKPLLQDGGIAIVSWYSVGSSPEKEREAAFWQGVPVDFSIRDMSVLTNAASGFTWRVAVLTPLHSDAHSGSGPTV